MPPRLCSGLGDPVLSGKLLALWREQGVAAARAHLNQLGPEELQGGGTLLQELSLRLRGAPGPRLLVDGVWFSRPHGGITRVWEQVLRCWALPDMVTSAAPVRILERDSHIALVTHFDAIPAMSVNPLDWSAFASLAADNGRHAEAWGADVFLSSWISTCGSKDGPCPELALVHDCIPERSESANSMLRALRGCWLARAGGFLSVSAATATDVAAVRQLPAGAIPWCQLAPAPVFAQQLNPSDWRKLQSKVGLRSPYVLLPATSAIGSYKNPELVVRALLEPGLDGVQLVLSGLAASAHAQQLAERWPALRERLVVAGFTDLQLVLAYRHALAVVLPSRIEGFGLPAIEALSAGATVLLADSPGLREAGGPACPRFHPEEPGQLAAWLRLLLHRSSSAWVSRHLAARRHRHLQHRNADLFGLALLTQARRLSDASRHGSQPLLS